MTIYDSGATQQCRKYEHRSASEGLPILAGHVVVLNRLEKKGGVLDE